MSLKRILVHYDATPRGERALTMALTLAQAQDAHLIGCAVEAEPRIPTYAAAQIPADVIDVLIAEQHKVIENAHKAFDKAMDANGWSDRSEFIETRGDVSRMLSKIGRGCDLIVVGQSEPDKEALEVEELPDNLVLESGRPILIVPYIGNRKPVGGHALLCWNDTREAARAMSDSLPLLNAASKVTVLSVDTTGRQTEVTGAGAARFLSAHGLDAELRRMPASGLDVGSAILNEAADVGADLIVMGAYGHSRLRESILGGATNTILKDMTLPVVMSH